ncbi:MAG: hypothetical protein WC755_09525 [Candidatus Woesearchaeota archaeon]|jgi:hypothetical protein
MKVKKYSASGILLANKKVTTLTFMWMKKNNFTESDWLKETRYESLTSFIQKRMSVTDNQLLNLSLKYGWETYLSYLSMNLLKVIESETKRGGATIKNIVV